MGMLWSNIWYDMKSNWVNMLEPPWRDSDPINRRDHWFLWLIGWFWALAGLALGSLYAPSIVQFVGLTHSPYYDWLVIGVAVLAGFVVQLLGWFLWSIASELAAGRLSPGEANLELPLLLVVGWIVVVIVVGLVAFVVAVLLPLAGVGYGFYLYFTHVGADQRTVTIAFVGGLLIKTFLIPLIKGIVTGAALKWLISALRGDKAKPRGA